MHRSLFTWMLLALVAIWFAGCGSGAPVTTKVGEFQRAQSNTVTPHGKIVPETAVETPTGVRYQTTSGGTFEIDMTPRDDGRYTYGKPRLIEQPVAVK